MQEVSRRLITTIIDSDASIPAAIRQTLLAIRDGVFDPAAPTSREDDDRLVSSDEVIRRLDWSRSKFFKDRALYPELTPIKSGSSARYSVVLVNQLVTRLSADAFQQGLLRLKGHRHVA